MKLRDLNFADEAACIADIDMLSNGWKTGGQWSLPQACYHLNVPLSLVKDEPAKGHADPEQTKRLGFLDTVIANGWPSGLPSPPAMEPPPHVGMEFIDALKMSLQRFAGIKQESLDTTVFGPLEIAKFRRFILIHAAHHLSFFDKA